MLDYSFIAFFRGKKHTLRVFNLFVNYIVKLLIINYYVHKKNAYFANEFLGMEV